MKWVLKYGNDYLQKLTNSSVTVTPWKNKALTITGTRDKADGFNEALIQLGYRHMTPEILDREDNVANQDKIVRS